DATGSSCLAVDANRHAAYRALDDAAFECDVLGLEIRDQSIEILDLEGDRSAGRGARLLAGEVGDRQAAAARQVILDPPAVAAIAIASDGEPELALVEVTRPRH